MISGITITDEEVKEAQAVVRSLYKNELGQPFEMTYGQAQIFVAITQKKSPRLHIQTHTRYGKSEIISMAILTCVTTEPEKWSIVAGNTDKAGIIMNDIIKHIFDNVYTKAKFIIPKGESEENIRRYRNKDRLNFALEGGLLGEVFITNAAGAMGFGAPNVVEDESALVNTNEHSLVMRMLADQPVNFLAKVGNPWAEEHFIKSFEDPNYAKIIIDYCQGIAEGRLLPEYIEEVRKEANFEVLWECKFPPQGRADEGNWVPLLTRDQVKKALVAPNHPGFGVQKLGCDVAGGGRNFSVVVERRENVAKIRYRKNEADTMTFAEAILGMSFDPIKRKDLITRANIAIDRVGMGKGVYDIIHRQIPGIRGVNAGDKVDPRITKDINDKLYFNLRAKMFWKAAQWIIAGGKLEMLPDENENNSIWYEMARLKYRTKLEGTQGKIQIMPKEVMLKEGIESPDVADSLSMTFAGPDIMIETEDEWEEQYEERRMAEKVKNPFNPFEI
jgi:hypothetical protein